MTIIKLEMSEEHKALIEEAMRDGGIATKKDFFNLAASMLIKVISESKKGMIICSVDEINKKYHEWFFPEFETVRNRGKSQLD